MRIQHISICSPVLELTRPSSSWVGDSSFPPAHIIYIYIERTPVPGRGFSPVNITINSAIPATETGFPAKENRHGQGYRLVHVHPDLCIPTHLRRPTRPRRVSASANWCWCLETHELVMGVHLPLALLLESNGYAPASGFLPSKENSSLLSFLLGPIAR